MICSTDIAVYLHWTISEIVSGGLQTTVHFLVDVKEGKMQMWAFLHLLDLHLWVGKAMRALKAVHTCF